MNTDSRLARAAEHINATELSDGRWAHYADETSRWYVVTDDELAELCDYIDNDDEQVSRDAYSHWCAGTSAEEMPAGWSPESELQYRVNYGNGQAHECRTKREAEALVSACGSYAYVQRRGDSPSGWIRVKR